MQLMIDGVNQQLSDIDFYDQTKKAVESANFRMDVHLPSYFRKNPWIRKAQSLIPPFIAEAFVVITEWTMREVFEVKRGLNYGAQIQPFLDTLKNQLVGKLNYPHPYFIENGIHSITFVPHG